MPKITLTDLTSLANDTSATNSINTNFQAIEDYINDNVLSRDTGAEVNTMQNELDMNSYGITNVDTINGVDVTDVLTGLTDQIAYAEEWANKAEDSLVSVAAGGDGVDDYSSKHFANKSAASASASASNAAASETSASTDSGLAAASASAASTAQTAAEAAQTAAETALDTFDDIYLGDKASDPALDNDGDALQTGALYFNTTDDAIYVYDGATWVAGYNSSVVSKTATTGSAVLPSGTTAQQDVSPSAGYLRFNTTNSAFEGYDGSAWGSLGGATGAGGDAVFYENDQTVDNDYTITSGRNAMSTGPITVSSGVSVTIPTGSVWVVL